MPPPWLCVPLALVLAAGHVQAFSSDFFSQDDSDVVPVGVRKVWRRSALFSDAANWEDGAVPCAGDRLVFPRSLRRGLAYVGGGPGDSPPVEAREVVLPWSGAVVLPARGSLIVGGEQSRSRACPGRDARWRVRPRASWLDPANWGPGEPPVDAKDLEAVPHLMRVPCGEDVAAFETDAFQVRLPEFPVRVGGLMIGKTLVTSRTRWFLFGDEDHFRPGRTGDDRVVDVLQIMARGAADLSDLPPQCGLGTHQDLGEHQGADVARMAADELLEAVCKHVTCAVPDCARPVRPHLHCCHVCGVVLELRPAGAAPLDDLRAMVRTEARDYESRWGAAAGPAVHVGVVPSQTAGDVDQIVLLGRNAEDLAAILEARLHARIGEGLTTSLLASGARMAPATVGSVLGMMVGTLLLVLVVLAVVVYHHDRSLPVPSRLAGLRNILGDKQSSFLFARFENSGGEDAGGVAVGVVPRPPRGSQGAGMPPGVRSARGSWSARSFRNPLYEQEQAEDDGGAPLQVTARGVAHENPLFSELQARVNGHRPEDGADDRADGVDVDLLGQGRVDPAPAAEPDDPTMGVKLVDIAL